MTLVNTTISGNTASSNGDLKKDRTALEVNGTFTQADIADGKIRYEHDDSNTTSDSLTFTVKDPAGNETGVKTFSITVTPVNDRPIVAYPIPDQHAEENQLFDFVVAANTFDDADPSDADNLTFSATLSDGSPLPTWLEFHATTRTLEELLRWEIVASFR